MTTRYAADSILIHEFKRNATPKEKTTLVQLAECFCSLVTTYEWMTSSRVKRIRYARAIRRTEESIYQLLDYIDDLVGSVALMPSRYLPESLQPLYKLGITN